MLYVEILQDGSKSKREIKDDADMELLKSYAEQRKKDKKIMAYSIEKEKFDRAKYEKTIHRVSVIFKKEEYNKVQSYCKKKNISINKLIRDRVLDFISIQ